MTGFVVYETVNNKVTHLRNHDEHNKQSGQIVYSQLCDRNKQTNAIQFVSLVHYQAPLEIFSNCFENVPKLLLPILL